MHIRHMSICMHNVCLYMDVHICTLTGLSRTVPDPASDCTATCILGFGYFLDA